MAGSSFGGAVGSPPVWLKQRSSVLWISSTVYVAFFTNYFFYGVLVSVIPFALDGQVGTPAKDAQKWTSVLLSIYGATLAVVGPIAGYISDSMRTRRQALLLDMFCIALAAILSCIALRIEVLIFARILEGLSSAILYTASQALLVETWSPANHGRAMGWLSILMTIGTMISPFYGGLIYDQAGYRMVFIVVFVLIGLCFAMRLAMVEKSVAKKWLGEEDGSIANDQDQEDRRGSVAPIGLEKELVNTTYTEAHGRDSQTILSVTNAKDFDGTGRQRLSSSKEDDSSSSRDSTSPEIATTTITTEPSKPTRSVYLRMLTSRRFLSMFYIAVIRDIIIISTDAVIPLFVADTFGWNATAAGLCFISFWVPFLSSPWLGSANDRYGTKWPPTIAFAITTPCYFALRFVEEDRMGDKVLLCALLAIIGFATAIVTVTCMTETAAATRALGITDRKSYAQAYGFNNCACGMGIVAGPLLGGLVKDSLGWKKMSVMFGVINAATTIICAVWFGEHGRIVKVEKKGERELVVGPVEVTEERNVLPKE